MTVIASAEPTTVDGASNPAPALLDLLGQATEVIVRLGDDVGLHSKDLEDLRGRLAEQRFHLAVLGQFKRGKSTLLNALLGNTVLPTSAVPLTAIPTFLFPGDVLQARISYQTDKATETFAASDEAELTAVLTRFATEVGNPNNRRDVAQVEVYHPAALLRRGVVLIDTPGIGSTFRHNTEATLNFLPQCDAALFLLSADPPLTEVEVEFLKEVRTKVTHLFFVLNKVDYLLPSEQEDVLGFLKKVLREQVGVERTEPIFCISAKQGLEARERDDAQLWESSGLGGLEKHLLRFLVSDKARVLRTAVAHKAADCLAENLMQLRLTIRSLQLPLADLDERRRLFERTLAETEQQRSTAQDLIAGDHKRLRTFLEDLADDLHQRAGSRFAEVVRSACSDDDGTIADNAGIHRALAKEIPAFFDRELSAMAQTFEQRVHEALTPHQQQADGLVESVRRAAAELFDITYRPLDSRGAFAFKRQPYWVTHHWQTTLSPISPQLIDRFMPRRIQHKRRLARLQSQTERLVVQNVENLRWATLQNLDEAIRRFSSQLDERLRETGAATQNAIRSAREQRQKHAETVAASLPRLEAAANELEAIQTAMQSCYDLP